MQERVKTSFIPKASLKVERTQSVQRTTVGIVNVVASVILIASIIAAIGMFAFEQYTKVSIENKRASLDRARSAFQPATIKELSRLNARLNVAGALLAGHAAPSQLFDFIETETLSSVRFSDFAFGEAGPGRVLVAMSGEARSFNAVALQSDAFGESDIFSEVIFSNLNIDTNGNVVFDFSAVVNMQEVAYQGRTDMGQGAPIVPEETGEVTTQEENL